MFTNDQKVNLKEEEGDVQPAMESERKSEERRKKGQEEKKLPRIILSL